MDEADVDALFARYVEHLVLRGVHLDVDALAAGDAAAVAALRERIQEFQRIEEALGRRLQPLTGRTLARYQVLEKLGAGGMGEVYRARDSDLDREVAVKVLPPIFAWDPERRARFEREARMLAALDHPNIAAIHGLERADSLQFLVLELVPGETLQERIARGIVPLAEALPLFRQIALALEAAHAKGIIHRDLKPANVKITPEGQAKVLDFGLGKTVGALQCADPTESLALSQEGTVTGLILGTAAYMSPEQARGLEVDRRTDVWSFGCVLYEALTGVRAFPGASFSEAVASILEREPDWSRLPASTPDAVGTLLRRCLAKNADRRLHDIADARIEIEEIIDKPRKPARDRVRKWAMVLGGVMLAAALFGRPWLRGSAPTMAGSPVPDTAALEAYRASFREANAHWRQAFERARGRPPGSEPYFVYVGMRRPPALAMIDGATHRVMASVPIGSKSNADLIAGVAVSPDGARAYLVNKNQNLVYVVDTYARSRLRTPKYNGVLVRDDPMSILMSHNGGRVAYVTASAGYVSVVDTDPASPTFHSARPVPDGDAIAVGREPRGLALTPDGTRLFVANGLSDSVSVVDTGVGSPTYHKLVSVPGGTQIQVGQEPWGVAIAPDGKRVYVTNTFSDSVSVIDGDRASATENTVIATIPLAAFPMGVAVTPDGTRVYVVARDRHEVAVIDTASQTILPLRIAGRETPTMIAIDPSGTRAYVTNVGSRDVSVIDTDPASVTFHTVLATVPLEGMPSSLAIGHAPPRRR